MSRSCWWMRAACQARSRIKGILTISLGWRSKGKWGMIRSRASQFRLPPIPFPGGQEQENEAHIKGHQPLPALLHEQLEVHKGEDDIDDHADADGDGLDDHVPIIIIEIAGGAVDQGQAVAAGRET